MPLEVGPTGNSVARTSIPNRLLNQRSLEDLQPATLRTKARGGGGVVKRLSDHWDPFVAEKKMLGEAPPVLVADRPRRRSPRARTVPLLTRRGLGCRGPLVHIQPRAVGQTAPRGDVHGRWAGATVIEP